METLQKKESNSRVPYFLRTRWGLWPYVRAEFLKIFALRIPQISFLAIFVGTYLFVAQLYHFEGLSWRMPLKNAYDAMPILVFATWRSLVFQVYIVAFSVFCTSIENQYGMIRVTCTQPLSRAEYAVGKYLAISLHIVLSTFCYVASLFFWTSLYSGLRGVSLQEVYGLGRFTIYTASFALAISWISISAALLRRTIVSGLITACAVCVGLGFMTTLTGSASINKYVFMKYFFFLLQAFPPWASWVAESFPVRPVADFYVAVLLTPTVIAVPAVLHFTRRDITE